VMDNIRGSIGLPAFANHQATGLDVHNSQGYSNYNALTVTLRNNNWHGLVVQSSYTLSKSLDTESATTFTYAAYGNSFNPASEYGVSNFDRTHIFNTLFSYNLPFGKGRFRSGTDWVNKAVGGWYVSGIVQASSGLPLTVTEGDTYGGGTGAATMYMIPTVPVSQIGTTGVYSNVAGSGSVGTTGNPAKNGSGLNLFANPAAAFADFRPILISEDGSEGRANPVRGLPIVNTDLRFGKETVIRERYKTELSADFFNAFNQVSFSNPTLSYTSPATFGVISSELVPGNRVSGSRWIQLGLRVSF
jgi:hypothetical protein